MEAICSFLVWGEGNLQLESSSLILTKKKKGKKGKYYANSLQFGFKHSLYYDEPFPLVQALPTCQDFFPLTQGREKKTDLRDAMFLWCQIFLIISFFQSFFGTIKAVTLSAERRIGFLQKENQNSFTKLQLHLTFYCSIAMMEWS